MKNEIVRKLTSLTLMTIMFAGGLTFAFPNTLPQAAAQQTQANLFVSAEKTWTNNMFDGPMVIEVIVNDPSLISLTDGLGEPSVTVGGKKLRMLQTTEGSWYAYFADKAMAIAADATEPRRNINSAGANQLSENVGPGTGLDFGKFCSNASGENILGFSVSDTQGIALVGNASNAVTGDLLALSAVASSSNFNGSDGEDGSTFTECVTPFTGASIAGFGSGAPDKNVYRLMNVVRENKTLTHATGSVLVGQLGMRDSNYWPFIQLYDFASFATIDVKYTKAGVTQTVTLTFDDPKGEKLTLDRTSYPRDAEVHVTVQDIQMNIDPTDEDSWTFGTISSNKTVFYQAFNQTGNRDSDDPRYASQGTVAQTTNNIGANNLAGNRTTLRFDGHDLTLNNNTQSASVAPVSLDDNNDSVMFDTPAGTSSIQFRTNTINHASLPITLTENDPNSGIFITYDENNDSLLQIQSTALRGTSATISYDEVGKSILVDSFFATIDMDDSELGGEWNSGELLPVVLVDPDANTNSLTEEELKVSKPATKLYPTITLGAPITLAKENSTEIFAVRDGFATTKFSFGNVVDQAGRIFTNIGPATTTDTFSDVLRLGLNTGITLESSSVIRFNLTTTSADLKTFLANGTKEGTSEPQDGLFHFLNFDIRSLESNGTNILAGSTFNFTIYDSLVGKCARIGPGVPTIACTNSLTPISSLGSLTSFSGLRDITNAASDLGTGSKWQDANPITIDLNFTTVLGNSKNIPSGNYTIAIDLFRIGTSNDGDDATGTDRFNDAIYRVELEETGINTSTFDGDIEFIMLNQLNINQSSTYTSGIDAFDDNIKMIVHEDLTDEDAVRINYNDLAGDGTILPVADQQIAPTHSGVVSFDFDTYKIADTVTVTLTDQDLNVDQEVIDIFTVVTTGTGGANDVAYDQVGRANYGTNSRGDNFGKLLEITFDDERWLDKDISSPVSSAACTTATLDALSSDGLSASGFTLVETGVSSGIFKGSFAVPAKYCPRGSSTVTTGALASTTGTDMEVNYVDYRDASGEIIEVGDGAGVRANTGSISLDRTVYPVPWGAIGDYQTAPTGKTPTTGTTTRSLFAIHETGIGSDTGAATNAALNTAVETIGGGDVVVHVRVNDPDFNPSPTGSDFINTNRTSASDGADLNYGPVKIMIQRGTQIAMLATAGGSVANPGVITNGDDPAPLNSAGKLTRTANNAQTRELGPISEVTPDSGIFELDFTIRYTDGPLSTKCPNAAQLFTSLNGTGFTSEASRFFTSTATSLPSGAFSAGSTSNGFHCILQGDIITVEYEDPTDASGERNTVTDSASFDLRNGVLQSDKSVYIIGSDMILTLIEPDFDRESDAAETYDLDLIEWDSDAAELTMGNRASVAVALESGLAFDPEPSNFRETGDSTGIFQIVIEIPSVIGGSTGKKLDRGEAIELEYTDWGPSGADFVGEENQDINLQIFTSNFGATVELDQKVYTWTDKVFITIVAPDHNFDSNLVDEIGETSTDPIIVQTRQAKLTNYKLTETGTDTGIFTGEVILAGFIHDADGNAATGDSTGNDITSSTTQTGTGPTDGKLSSTDNDGLTVSFEFNEDETVIGSALIRWNIGEVSWLEASYPATGTGVVRIVDPDMNLNPESVDNFRVDTWSDSDAGGIDLTVTETNEATGIFEGTVFFTVTDESSGHRLRVAEGDTITAEYEDNTLPDPYTRADELEITGTAIIGTIVPPLERAPASNARVVDAFGNSLTSVSVDQQVQIAADLSNGQDRDQKFAYLVQIQDSSGVTVSLAWITGSLTAGQSFSPALSWIPGAPGTYTATVFVWESVDNPTALSPTVTTTINVS